jgi:hypothetical protein
MIPDDASRSFASRRLVRMSGVLLIWLASGCVASTAEALCARQGAESHHFRFDRKGSGRTIKKGAIEVSFTRFESEDGIPVERLVEKYASEGDASAELENLVAHASKVIERNYKKAWDGRQVGSRIQVVSEKSPASRKWPNVVAWTDKSRVVLLRSSSVVHLLDFEQQDYPASPPKSTTAPRQPLPLPVK